MTVTSTAVSEDRAVARALAGGLAILLLIGVALPWYEYETSYGNAYESVTGLSLGVGWIGDDGGSAAEALASVLPPLAVLVCAVLLAITTVRPGSRMATSAAVACVIAALGLLLLLLLFSGEDDLHAPLPGLVICLVGTLAACGAARWNLRLTPAAPGRS